MGAGAVVVNAMTEGGVSQVGVGLTFALVVTAMVYALGGRSGAHINPAVTLGFALAQRFPLTWVPLYWVAQLLGAAVAALVLWALFGNVSSLGATLPVGPALQSLGPKTVLTFVLGFVVLGVATGPRAEGAHAALAIGAVVALGATFAGPFSGASMNPARSFGPALVSGAWTHHWVYWGGPLTGAALGVLAHQVVRKAVPPGTERDP